MWEHLWTSGCCDVDIHIISRVQSVHYFQPHRLSRNNVCGSTFGPSGCCDVDIHIISRVQSLHYFHPHRLSRNRVCGCTFKVVVVM